LVNRAIIKAGASDKLSEFFRVSADKIFVLLDDHVEIATLLNKWECTELGSGCNKNAQLIFPSEDKLKKLVGQSKVAISSDLADITKHPKFALAYTWSGDAIQKTSTQPNLEFILHPSLSHSSMDLITLVGESKEAKCVADELASKEFVDSVAQKSKYFSPYGPVQSDSMTFNQLQIEFFKQFATLGRIHRVTQDESLEIDKKWQLFKILFGSKI
jgi:spermidine/putrescine-binding protein